MDRSDSSPSTAELFRVPKVPVRVRLVLEGGAELDGELFVAPAAAGHEGRERVVDLLAREHRFLPLATATGVLMVNADRVAMVRIEDPLDAGIDRLAGAGAGQDVPVRLAIGVDRPGDLSIEASLHLEMPPERSRLIDQLNDESRFCTVVRGGELLLVSKRHILTIEPLA